MRGWRNGVRFGWNHMTRGWGVVVGWSGGWCVGVRGWCAGVVCVCWLCAVGCLVFGVGGAVATPLSGGVVWRVSGVSMPSVLPAAQRGVQQVAVYASGGSFALSFEGESTGAIAFDASDVTVAKDLEGLSTVGGVGGKVLVSGGPGGVQGGFYRVTFSGTLGFVAVPQMTVDGEGLTGGVATALVSTVTPGGEGEGVLRVVATNVGGVASSGVVSVSALQGALPTGVTATGIEGEAAYEEEGKKQAMSCVLASLSCSYARAVAPGDAVAVIVHLGFADDAPAKLSDVASVSGGGGMESSASNVFMVGSGVAAPGVLPGSFFSVPSIFQAGGRPDLTSAFALSTRAGTHGAIYPVGSLDDVHVALPAGMVGNAASMPRCPQSTFYVGKCQANTMVGMASIYLTIGAKPTWVTKAIYNLVPEEGQVVDLGFEVKEEVWVHIFARVRTGSDYGVTAVVENTSESADVLASSITIWGVPAQMSGPGRYEFIQSFIGEGSRRPFFGGLNAQQSGTPPFLSNPTGCQGALSSSMEVSFWQNAGVFETLEAEAGETTGCEDLQFAPSITVAPEKSSTSSSTGLNVDLRVPQDEAPEDTATADLRDAVVQLPEGFTINPAQAAGLQACSPTQIMLSSPAPAQCPAASAVGRVWVHTPLIDHSLEGYVYLATQNENPFGSLIALYIAIDDKATGVVVKIAGRVELDPVTGRITARFENTPQVPFEDFKLEFFGGEKAPLVTPAGCGTYTATTELTPWSSPYTPVATTSSQPIQITAGCGTQSFLPTLTAGTTSNQAASYSPLSTTFTRKDGEGVFLSVSLTLPEGVLANLSDVTLCPEAQANAGTCEPASLIGEAAAAAGVGDPVWVTGGRVYLTASYQGAPYGLSIVVPAVAGPFNLGNQVVRATVNINPQTAQVTITTPSAGANEIPTILQGIPLNLQTIYTNINRPHFTLNPTSCAPLQITGSATSTTGANAPLASRFQAANCARLPFKPGFVVSSQAKHTRRYGAYLHVKLTSSEGQANIKSVFVELPKILPSRQETLKHSCPETQYNTNPAGCPPESQVGTAILHTPLLPVPLTGPAILVSHGGAAFPDLDLVLQGYGITIKQTGTVNITKGITTTNFKTIPDAPFTNLELTLPPGPHSILTATTNLCTTTIHTTTHKHHKTIHHTTTHHRTITIPTTITAQNNATIHQNTPIIIAGCKNNTTTRHHKK